MWLKLEQNRTFNRDANKNIWVNMEGISYIRIDYNHNHIHFSEYTRFFKVPITEYNLGIVRDFLRREQMSK